MNILMKKFGDVLTSRPAGREAYSAFLPTLKTLSEAEVLVLDFDGINTFSPSWGDEFLTPIQKHYGDRLMLKNTMNSSVTLTLSTLEKANGFRFRLVK